VPRSHISSAQLIRAAAEVPDLPEPIDLPKPVNPPNAVGMVQTGVVSQIAEPKGKHIVEEEERVIKAVERTGDEESQHSTVTPKPEAGILKDLIGFHGLLMPAKFLFVAAVARLSGWIFSLTHVGPNDDPGFLSASGYG